MYDIMIIEEKNNLEKSARKLLYEVNCKNKKEEYGLALVNREIADCGFDIRTKCLLINENIMIKSSRILAKQIISCGMSEKSTICFSSIEEERATLCIKRTIEAFSGKSICPCEIPCCYNRSLSVEENLLLCAAKLYYNE